MQPIEILMTIGKYTQGSCLPHSLSTLATNCTHTGQDLILLMLLTMNLRNCDHSPIAHPLRRNVQEPRLQASAPDSWSHLQSLSRASILWKQERNTLWSDIDWQVTTENNWFCLSIHFMCFTGIGWSFLSSVIKIVSKMLVILKILGDALR